MSDILLPRQDAISPEELLAAAGLADSLFETAQESCESAELDPGQRRLAELRRAKTVRWLVNECYYGEPCDPETGSPYWMGSPEEAPIDTIRNLLDEDHSRAIRYMVARVGSYQALDDDEAWFQNLV